MNECPECGNPIADLGDCNYCYEKEREIMAKNNLTPEEVRQALTKSLEKTDRKFFFQNVDINFDGNEFMIVGSSKAGQLQILRELLEEVEGLVVTQPVVSLEGQPVVSLDWSRYLKLLDLIHSKIEELKTKDPASE